MPLFITWIQVIFKVYFWPSERDDRKQPFMIEIGSPGRNCSLETHLVGTFPLPCSVRTVKLTVGNGISFSLLHSPITPLVFLLYIMALTTVKLFQQVSVSLIIYLFILQEGAPSPLSSGGCVKTCVNQKLQENNNFPSFVQIFVGALYIHMSTVFLSVSCQLCFIFLFYPEMLLNTSRKRSLS